MTYEVDEEANPVTGLPSINMSAEQREKETGAGDELKRLVLLYEISGTSCTPCTPTEWMDGCRALS